MSSGCAGSVFGAPNIAGS